MATWSVQPGTVMTRTEVMERLGGSIQGGIQTPRDSPYVLVYSDREEGAKYGYLRDGWRADGGFDYTGAGNEGDQVMLRGNRAIAQHHEDGRQLLLFEAASHRSRGGKLHRFVGEFQVDASAPYSEVRDVDRHGNERTVFVFHLRPVGPSAIETGDEDTAELAGVDDPDQGVRDSRLVESEGGDVTTFTRNGVAPGEGERREHAFEVRFRAWLESRGGQPKRYRLAPGNGLKDLVTDTFDLSDRMLYETKASASRHHIRLALGQLFDYERFIDGGVSGLAIVVPEWPTDDLVDLLRCHEVGLIVEDRGVFTTVLQAGPRKGRHG